MTLADFCCHLNVIGVNFLRRDTRMTLVVDDSSSYQHFGDFDVIYRELTVFVLFKKRVVICRYFVVRAKLSWAD